MNTTFRLVEGCVLQQLAMMSPDSVQCVVTSPPYWGLRDYGIEPSVWGGEAAHEHEWETSTHSGGGGQHSDKVRWNHTGAGPSGHPKITTAFCPCGAWLGCLGLEPTPALYVAHIVEVFTAVWRVLRTDGTLWINLGDSYANDEKWGDRTGGKHAASLHGENVGRGKRRTGLKPKDLIGIPWAVAFALRDAGWYLRRDVVWSKPNPMPESVTDRPTTAHEYIFLLTKSERYFYNGDAIREPSTGNAHSRGNGVNPKAKASGQNSRANVDRVPRPRKNNESQDHRKHGFNERLDATEVRRSKQNESFSAAVTEPVLTRNKRSVWTIATQPFLEAHFATFPEEIPRTCILAGTKPGDLVLDPFNGAGTTGVAALALGRNYIGIERKPEYVEMSRRRLSKVAPLFARERVEAAP